jgi:hypothetical protein
MKRNVIMIMLMLFIVSSYAQVGSIFNNPSFQKPDLTFSSLFNPNTFSMSHSASFMSGVSSSQNAFYQSVYTTHMKFKFHPKLTMGVDMNFVNFGTASLEDSYKLSSNRDNSTMIVPDLNLTYKPNENMFIRFEFRHAGYVDNNFNKNSQYWGW